MSTVTAAPGDWPVDRWLSPMAGKTLCQRQPIDPAAIVAACFAVCPDPAIAVQRVRFGTSGHRGSSQSASF